ncbi:MAG: hypothetical protein D6728_01435 [Cyanobacteria bacterium J055]|nr:MAG: hypothetical protein D6728_01435 [Cyanobacteria bacterium J055]
MYGKPQPQFQQGKGRFGRDIGNFLIKRQLSVGNVSQKTTDLGFAAIQTTVLACESLETLLGIV